MCNKTDKRSSSLYNCIDYGKIFAKEILATHVEVIAKTNKGIDIILTVIINEANLDKVKTNLIINDNPKRTCKNYCLIL